MKIGAMFRVDTQLSHFSLILIGTSLAGAQFGCGLSTKPNRRPVPPNNNSNAGHSTMSRLLIVTAFLLPPMLCGCGGAGGSQGESSTGSGLPPPVASPTPTPTPTPTPAPAPSNRSPVLGSPPTDQLLITGHPFSYDVSQHGTSVTDPDGDPLSYHLTVSG